MYRNNMSCDKKLFAVVIVSLYSCSIDTKHLFYDVKFVNNTLIDNKKTMQLLNFFLTLNMIFFQCDIH